MLIVNERNFLDILNRPHTMPTSNSYKPKVTPSISRKEFARRRRHLMQQMEVDSIAIVPSASTLIRNRDAEFKFRQDSDFHYLTGFNEPEAVLVLIPGRAHGECLLFCRERDPERELWDGYRQGPEGVVENFGADDAFPISDIDDILPGLLESRERVYYAMGKWPDFDRQVMDWVNVLRANARAGAHPPGEFLDLDHLLHDLRLYKSAAELRVMRAAACISAEAHMRAMAKCRPGMMEYELEAEYLYAFGAAGAQHPAYSSIVGAGVNGCILHYVENDSMIRDGDLVLVDAGCELNCYASDITRTFPANGKFSKAQQALYEVVLDAQLEAIKVAVPGNHWNEPHDVTVSVITQGLIDLKLLSGELNELVETEAYKPFYMHRAGHWLGMDVHDVGDYKVHDEWRVLEPGMVMTIEPGIYVAAANTKVAAKWRGIGIRIEDDIALTQSGNDVLTRDVCKSVADIEAHMRQSHASSPVLGAAKASAASKRVTAKSVATVKTKATAKTKAKPKVKSKASLKSKAASKSKPGLKAKAASSRKAKPTKKTLPKKKSPTVAKKSPQKPRLSKRK